MALSERSVHSNYSNNYSNTKSSDILYGKFSASQLLTLCDQLIATYNPSQVTPTTHACNFISSKKIKDENVCIFLKQVFYGFDRHNKAIRLVCKGFYNEYCGQTVKTDEILYCIVIYLIIFRINDLRFSDLKRFIYASEPTKMIILLQFIFSEHMNGWLTDALSKVYDHNYVKNEIIACLMKKKSKMLQITDDMARKSLITTQKSTDQENVEPNDGTSKTTINITKHDPKTTTPKPFNFTKRIPKGIKKPSIVIPLDKFDIKKIPKSTYDTEKLNKIQMQNKKRKHKILQETTQKYAKEKEFESASLNRPTNIEKIRESVEKDISKTMEFSTVIEPLPKFEESCPVRMNTAAILREDALFQKQQTDEANHMKEYEFSLHDANEYDNWRTQELNKDEISKIEEINQRRIEMKECRELAKDAVMQTIELKKVDAIHQKQEQKLRVIENEQVIEKETIEKRVIAQQIHQSHQNAVKAVENVVKSNQQEAYNEKKIQKVHKNSKLKQQSKELKQKKELIKQIQQMEKEIFAKANEPKDFDPTTTAGQGLLCELSVSQLQNKLKSLKHKQKQQIESKRTQILHDKHYKRSELLQKAQNLCKIRQMRAQTAKQNKETKLQHKRTLKHKQQLGHENEILKTNKKIKKLESEKQATLKEFANEIQIARQKQKQWEKQNKNIQKMRWRSYSAGLERFILTEQNRVHLATQSKFDLETKATNQRKANNLALKKQKNEQRHTYDESLSLSRTIQNDVLEQTANIKAQQVAAIHKSQSTARQKYLHAKPYENMLEQTRISKVKPSL